MSDREAAQLAGCGGGGDVGVADKAFHLPGNRLGQRIEVFCLPLGDHLHVPVGQVAHVAGNRVAAGEVLGRVTESDPLHDVDARYHDIYVAHNVRLVRLAYLLGASRLDAEDFGRAVRAHWGIENRDHHVRDRILREDDSRIRRKPGIFARLRSFALNILRAGGVGNVSEAVYVNALSLDQLLAYGLAKSTN